MSICPKCGAECPEAQKICKNCGWILSDQPISDEPVDRNAKLKSALSGGVFLTMCLLQTVYTVLNFGLLQLLFAIFGWIIYAKAKNGETPADMMRSVSGTVYASKIIFNVCAVIILVCAAVVYLCSSVVPTQTLAEIYDAFENEFIEAGVNAEIISALGIFANIGLKDMMIGLAALMLAAGVLFIVYTVMYGRIHRFSKSLYWNAMNENSPLVGEKEAYAWLIVGAVLNGLSAVLSVALFAIGLEGVGFSTVVASVAYPVIFILGAVTVKKIRSK